MLTKSARIIGENLWFYLLMALLVMALETVNRLGFLGRSSHAGILFVFAYLSANLPLVIVQGITLTAAVRQRGHGRLAAGFKVALIAAIIVGLTVYLFLKVLLSKGPLGSMVTSDYAAFLAIVVLALPAVVTLLGSWIPAGIMGKDPGFISAVGRGVMSIHTVYWRLVLSLALFVFLASALGVAYVMIAGKAPFLTTDSGSPEALGIAYWYLVTLSGMFLLTYVNTVICMDYMRFEKISLDEPSQTLTTAQS